MAYLDLSVGELHLAPFTSRSVELPRRGLSPTEREAVRLARQDKPGSLKPAGRLRRMVQSIFGLSRPNRLADPRLEGLRRFAVTIAHDGSTAIEREEAQLRSLGFSEDQIASATAIAAGFRPRRSSKAVGMYVSLSATTGGIFVWFDRYIGDPQISFILALVLALPVWAIAAPRS